MEEDCTEKGVEYQEWFWSPEKNSETFTYKPPWGYGTGCYRGTTSLIERGTNLKQYHERFVLHSGGEVGKIRFMLWCLLHNMLLEWLWDGDLRGLESSISTPFPHSTWDQLKDQCFLSPASSLPHLVLASILICGRRSNQICSHFQIATPPGKALAFSLHLWLANLAAVFCHVGILAGKWKISFVFKPMGISKPLGILNGQNIFQE